MRVTTIIIASATIIGIAIPAIAAVSPPMTSLTTTTTVYLGDPEQSIGGPFGDATFFHEFSAKFDNSDGIFVYSIDDYGVGRTTGIKLNGRGGSRITPTYIPADESQQVIITGDPEGNGGFEFNYGGRSSATPGISMLTRKYSPSFPYYQLQVFEEADYFPSNLNTNNYKATVAIQGSINDSHYTHSPATYAGGWYLVDDFRFDGAFTYVTVVNEFSAGGRPDLRFTISAIPEPGMLPLMTVGLLGLIGVCRRGAVLRA